MFTHFFSFLQKLIADEKEKYVLKRNKFSRNRKMNFKDFVYYIFGNMGKTSVLELDEFFSIKNGIGGMSITKQDLSKQRSFLSPLIFKDTNDRALKDIYCWRLFVRYF
jgi:hypothetical protein